MPLSAARLGTSIKTRLLAIGCEEPAAGQGVTLTDMSNAIAAAVVDELATNATIVPLLLASPSGPVTGTGGLT